MKVETIWGENNRVVEVCVETKNHTKYRIGLEFINEDEPGEHRVQVRPVRGECDLGPIPDGALPDYYHVGYAYKVACGKKEIESPINISIEAPMGGIWVGWNI